MKKLISLFGLLLIISTTMFTSCNPEAKPDKGTSDPIEKPSDTEKPELVTKEFTLADMELDGNKPSSSWAYFTEDLSAFAGKEVTINLTADVEVENNTTEDYKIWFQINNGSEYPGVNGETDLFAPGTNKKTITGSTKITINSGALLYLTTHNTTADVKIKITNFKYTVTSDGSAEEEKPSEPAKEYPTDIFTVGEAGTCGIQIGDGELKPFEIIKKDAADVVVNSDGSVQWISTAIGGGAGGVSFYIKEDKSEINIANYESIELEFVYSPITGKWSSKARNPEFCLRILPWDATGLFGGAIDLQYFSGGSEYGTYKGTISIPTDFKEKIINSSDEDCVLGFGLKFNDWNSNNKENFDQIRVQLKKVKFNKKAGAPADEER